MPSTPRNQPSSPLTILCKSLAFAGSLAMLEYVESSRFMSSYRTGHEQGDRVTKRQEFTGGAEPNAKMTLSFDKS